MHVAPASVGLNEFQAVEIKTPDGDMVGLAQELLKKGCTDQFHALEMASAGEPAS